VWKITTDELYRISVFYGAKIHAFVMMSNHTHLLISTPEADLGKCMEEFGKRVTAAINSRSGRSGHVFGGRYKWSLVQSPIYYAYALKYIYRNPVRAGMVQAVEDYPFSTLHGLLGRSRLPFPIHYPIGDQDIGFYPHGFDELVEWLNQPFQNELLLALDTGMRRKVLTLPDSLVPFMPPA
jgi:REP element-mobilizing transposase RayT